MTELAALFRLDADWLDVLPTYQQELLRELARTRSLEDVARAWLEVGTASATVGYGAGQSARLFYDAVQNLMHDLLCSDNKFVEERRRLLDEAKAGQAAFAAYIGSVLGPHVGTATPILSAVVVVTCSIISKAGLQTWCQQQVERRRQPEPPPGQDSNS